MLSVFAMAHFLIPSGPILLGAWTGPENGVVGSVGRPPETLRAFSEGHYTRSTELPARPLCVLRMPFL